MKPSKAPYVKGSNGSRPTPTQIPPKPLPAFVHTRDVSIFQAPTKARGKK